MLPSTRTSNHRSNWKIHSLDKELFHHNRQQDSFEYDYDDDDSTVVTSNNFRNHSTILHHQQQKMIQARKNALDNTRAPKIAAVLFLTFFSISGPSYFIQSIQNSSGGNSNDIVIQNQDITGAMNGTDANIMMSSNYIPHLIEEMSKPNLDRKGDPIRIPPELSTLADINVPLGGKHEKPIFWHIPRSGGSTMKDIASHCYGLTLASEVGPFIDPVAATQDQLITVIDVNTNAKFVNVDTTSLEGIERARAFNLASYDELDLIVTPYIFLASDAFFNSVNRGRTFVLFRHPIERAVSMYYYLRYKSGIRGAQIGDTLELYAKSSLVENNWMTRFLTNKMGGEISQDDEALAKEILRTKVLVGLLSQKTESLRRFKSYFGWNDHDNGYGNQQGVEDCEDKLLHWGWKGKNKHEKIIEGSDAFNLLKEQNAFDIRLYEYAEKLFEVQGATLFAER